MNPVYTFECVLIPHSLCYFTQALSHGQEAIEQWGICVTEQLEEDLQRIMLGKTK